MIKATKGRVKLKGSGPVLLADLTLAVKTLNNAFIENGMSAEASKLFIAQVTEVAFLPGDNLAESLNARATAFIEELNSLKEESCDD